MNEKERFLRFPSAATTDQAKNQFLATKLAAGALSKKAIVKIERIEIGPDKGWRVTYRQ